MNIDKLYYKLGVDTSPLEAGIKRSKQQFNSLGGVVAKVGAQFGVAFGFASVIRGIVNVTTEFDHAARQVWTLLDKTELQLNDVKEKLMELSTLGPYTARELAEGLYETVSAGVDSANAMEFLEKSMHAAMAGATDLFTATDGLTTIMNAWNYEMQDLDHVIDVVFNTIKYGKTYFHQLARYIGTVAPSAAMAGASLEEVLSAAATLTKTGLKTRRAMTGLNYAMQSVIKPTKQAKDVAEKLGITFDAATLKAMGLAKFLDYVGQAADMNEEKLARLFGSVEALRAVFGLLGTGRQEFQRILALSQDLSYFKEEFAATYEAKMFDDAIKDTEEYNTKASELKDTMDEVEKGISDTQSELSEFSGTTFSLDTQEEELESFAGKLTPTKDELKALNTAAENTKYNLDEIISAITTEGKDTDKFDYSAINQALSDALSGTDTTVRAFKDKIKAIDEFEKGDLDFSILVSRLESERQPIKDKSTSLRAEIQSVENLDINFTAISDALAGIIDDQSMVTSRQSVMDYIEKIDEVGKGFDFENITNAFANLSSQTGKSTQEIVDALKALKEEPKNFDKASFSWVVDSLNDIKDDFNIPVSDLIDMVLDLYDESNYDTKGKTDFLWVAQDIAYASSMSLPLIDNIKKKLEELDDVKISFNTVQEALKLAAEKSGAETSIKDIKELIESLNTAGISDKEGDAFPKVVEALSALKDETGETIEDIIAEIDKLNTEAPRFNQIPENYRTVLKRMGWTNSEIENLFAELSSYDDNVTFDELLGAFTELTTESEATANKVGGFLSTAFELAEQQGITPSEVMGKINVMLENTQSATGEAQEAYEKTKESLKTTFNEMRNSIQRVGLEIGQALTPIMKDISDLIKGVADWISGLSDAGKQVLFFGGALSALIPTVVNLFNVMKAAGGTFGGWVNIISMVVSGVTAAIVAFQGWKTATSDAGKALGKLDKQLTAISDLNMLEMTQSAMEAGEKFRDILNTTQDTQDAQERLIGLVTEYNEAQRKGSIHTDDIKKSIDGILDKYPEFKDVVLQTNDGLQIQSDKLSEINEKLEQQILLSMNNYRKALNEAQSEQMDYLSVRKEQQYLAKDIKELQSDFDIQLKDFMRNQISSYIKGLKSTREKIDELKQSVTEIQTDEDAFARIIEKGLVSTEIPKKFGHDFTENIHEEFVNLKDRIKKEVKEIPEIINEGLSRKDLSSLNKLEEFEFGSVEDAKEYIEELNVFIGYLDKLKERYPDSYSLSDPFQSPLGGRPINYTSLFDIEDLEKSLSQFDKAQDKYEQSVEKLNSLQLEYDISKNQMESSVSNMVSGTLLALKTSRESLLNEGVSLVKEGLSNKEISKKLEDDLAEYRTLLSQNADKTIRWLKNFLDKYQYKDTSEYETLQELVSSQIQKLETSKKELDLTASELSDKIKSKEEEIIDTSRAKKKQREFDEYLKMRQAFNTKIDEVIAENTKLKNALDDSDKDLMENVTYINEVVSRLNSGTDELETMLGDIRYRNFNVTEENSQTIQKETKENIKRLEEADAKAKDLQRTLADLAVGEVEGMDKKLKGFSKRLKSLDPEDSIGLKKLTRDVYDFVSEINKMQSGELFSAIKQTDRYDILLDSLKDFVDKANKLREEIYDKYSEGKITEDVFESESSFSMDALKNAMSKEMQGITKLMETELGNYGKAYSDKMKQLTKEMGFVTSNLLEVEVDEAFDPLSEEYIADKIGLNDAAEIEFEDFEENLKRMIDSVENNMKRFGRAGQAAGSEFKSALTGEEFKLSGENKTNTSYIDKKFLSELNQESTQLKDTITNYEELFKAAETTAGKSSALEQLSGAFEDALGNLGGISEDLREKMQASALFYSDWSDMLKSMSDASEASENWGNAIEDINEKQRELEKGFTQGDIGLGEYMSRHAELESEIEGVYNAFNQEIVALENLNTVFDKSLERADAMGVLAQKDKEAIRQLKANFDAFVSGTKGYDRQFKALYTSLADISRANFEVSLAKDDTIKKFETMQDWLDKLKQKAVELRFTGQNLAAGFLTPVVNAFSNQLRLMAEEYKKAIDLRDAKNEFKGLAETVKDLESEKDVLSELFGENDEYSGALTEIQNKLENMLVLSELFKGQDAIFSDEQIKEYSDKLDSVTAKLKELKRQKAAMSFEGEMLSSEKYLYYLESSEASYDRQLSVLKSMKSLADSRMRTLIEGGRQYGEEMKKIQAIWDYLVEKIARVTELQKEGSEASRTEQLKEQLDSLEKEKQYLQDEKAAVESIHGKGEQYKQLLEEEAELMNRILIITKMINPAADISALRKELSGLQADINGFNQDIDTWKDKISEQERLLKFYKNAPKELGTTEKIKSIYSNMANIVEGQLEDLVKSGQVNEEQKQTLMQQLMYYQQQEEAIDKRADAEEEAQQKEKNKLQQQADYYNKLIGAVASGFGEFGETGQLVSNILSHMNFEVKELEDGSSKLVSPFEDMEGLMKNIQAEIAAFGIQQLMKLGANLVYTFKEVKRIQEEMDKWDYDEQDLNKMLQNFRNFEENKAKLQEKMWQRPFNAFLDAITFGIFGFTQQIDSEIEELRKKLDITFNDIASNLGMGIGEITGALEDAFSSDTYEEFLRGFTTSLEEMVKQSLIKAFVAQSLQPIIEEYVKNFVAKIDDEDWTVENAQEWKENLEDALKNSGMEEFFGLISNIFDEMEGYGDELGGADAVRRTITEDTGNRLAALLTTINMHVASIDNTLNYGTLKVQVTNINKIGGTNASDYMTALGVV